MTETKHVPDIIEVISDLSNDEVRTPPRVANQVLDLLPEEVWSNPDYRWLDPGTKSGVFLREATKRLMVGLEEIIPDEASRLEHILTKQMFGIAISELTGLMARRALYCAKDAAGENSIVQMSAGHGNIWHERVTHPFKNQRCPECGASQAGYGSLTSENHAYGFIHANGRENFGKAFEMQFDVIVGNPPYQLADSSDSPSATPLYNEFVDMARSLKPRFISMVIPSRWMGGGKGLDQFRSSMLGDSRLSKLVDFFNAADLFPQVGINGGVCYFLWDSEADGPCKVTTHRNGELIGPNERRLDEHDVFIRDERAASIVRRLGVRQNMSPLVSSLKPFGLRTFDMGEGAKSQQNNLKLYQRGGIGWVPKTRVLVNKESVGLWKVLLLAVGSGREREKNMEDVVFFKPIVAEPNSACTETYLSLGPVTSETEARSLASYMRTRFVRFLVSLRKSGQHINRGLFAFVPVQTWDREWTDEALFDLYGFNADEIGLIQSTIREMPSS